MTHSTDRVPDSPSEIRPLLIGASVPKVTLQTVDGDPFNLGAAVSERPSVLIFYRGGW